MGFLRMEEVKKTALGFFALESIRTLEITILHDLAVEPLRPTFATDIKERQLLLRQPKAID